MLISKQTKINLLLYKLANHCNEPKLQFSYLIILLINLCIDGRHFKHLWYDI